MEFVKKIYKKFVISNIYMSDKEPNVDKWYELLNGLKKPKDNIDMAYNKYVCRCDYFPLYKRIVLNVLAFGATIVALPRIALSQDSLRKPEDDLLLIERASNVDYEDVIPNELFAKYSRTEETSQTGIVIGKICIEAKKKYIKCILRHPFHCYLNYWILKELSIHSEYLLKYNPIATAVYINERNVASPIVRELYEDGNRELISFMHGEYLLQLIQAYFSFSKYYVWDPCYIEMFKNDLRCDVGEYVVYTPKKLQKKWSFGNETPEYDITYYFSGESESSVKFLAGLFKKLSDNGKRVKIRPHPRDSHVQLIKTYFKDFFVEDCAQISMQESLRNTKYVAGLTTTVLSEAIAEGKEIILDDMSNPPLYNNLEKRKYIILKQKYIKLSDYMIQNGY